jgi:MoaA/NifB/PqqE/SkfB family radical SAM enzyme
MIPLTSKIRVVHLETTDVCQAACPLCARETNLKFDRDQQHHLTVCDIDRVLTSKHIADLHKVFACGNYGDPAAGKHTLEIFHHIRTKNPNVVLGMNTNGGLRNHAWWIDLARLLNQPRDYVVFSIDGLSDTNHIYRVGVNWDTVIDNAQTFISAGGQAHWDMLVYAHNEHQVDDCEQLARQLGFKWFRAKVSKRPLSGGLANPQHWNASATPTKPILCQAIADQSIYIDAQGRVSACCWLGVKHPGTSIDQVSSTWPGDNPHATCLKKLWYCTE